MLFKAGSRLPHKKLLTFSRSAEKEGDKLLLALRYTPAAAAAPTAPARRVMKGNLAFRAHRVIKRNAAPSVHALREAIRS